MTDFEIYAAFTFAQLARGGETADSYQIGVNQWGTACGKPYGHAAQPWKTWDILCDLEQAVGDAAAARAARAQALALYLAYRRDGGESYAGGARLCALVAEAVQQGAEAQAEQTLAELAQGEIPTWLQIFLPKLRRESLYYQQF